MKYIIIALIFLLVSCAPFNEDDNPQVNAGITNVQIELCPLGPVDAPTAYALCRVSYIDGKERTTVTLDLDWKEGMVAYSAGVSAAFEGQALRALVEKALIESRVEIADDLREGLVTGIMEALKKSFGMPF
tara:strand:- start:846 stop:1238 length:393 start_codon:yes stop_codon:yes gene_type:complete